MKNTLRMIYTVCYDTTCMHNDHSRCKRGLALDDCRRRCKYMSKRHGLDNSRRLR